VVIYEVNIQVPREMVIDYSAWLRLHVDEMLRFDVFYAAEVYVRHSDEENDEEGFFSHFTVHYRARDLEAVESYLQNQAPRMRQRVIEVFKSQVKISRRILSRIRSDELRGSEPNPLEDTHWLRTETDSATVRESIEMPPGSEPKIGTLDLDSDPASV